MLVVVEDESIVGEQTVVEGCHLVVVFRLVDSDSVVSGGGGEVGELVVVADAPLGVVKVSFGPVQIGLGLICVADLIADREVQLN